MPSSTSWIVGKLNPPSYVEVVEQLIGVCASHPVNDPVTYVILFWGLSDPISKVISPITVVSVIDESKATNVWYFSASKVTEEVYNKIEPVSNILAVSSTLFSGGVNWLPVLDCT